MSLWNKDEYEGEERRTNVRWHERMPGRFIFFSDCVLPDHPQWACGTDYQGLGLLLSSFDWSSVSLIPARYLAISFLDS